MKAKHRIVLIDGMLCVQGGPDLIYKDLWEIPVGTKIYNIGYERNSSCRGAIFEQPCVYSGVMTLNIDGELTEYCAFKCDAIRTSKEQLFPVDEKVYLLMIANEGDGKKESNELWHQDFVRMVLKIFKPYFIIDDNGEKKVLDLRNDYWKKRHGLNPLK